MIKLSNKIRTLLSRGRRDNIFQRFDFLQITTQSVKKSLRERFDESDNENPHQIRQENFERNIFSDNVLSINFYVHAILTLYKVTSNRHDRFFYELISAAPDFHKIEAEALRKSKTLEYLGISDAIDLAYKSGKHLEWKCEITFKTSKTTLDYDIKFKAPTLSSISCFFWEKFGSDRFICASIINIEAHKEDWAPQCELFQKGLHFCNRHYVFLGGTLKQKSTGKRDIHEKNDLIFWFFAETEDGTNLPAIKADQAFNSLGNFEGQYFMKQNERLKLGFSSAFPMSLSIDSDQIYVVRDIESDEGNLFTDGCGFIGTDLLRTIPYGITMGKCHCNHRDNIKLPVVIQVRMISKKGLFKGCLIANPRPEYQGRIVFRDSMKKADRSIFTDFSDTKETLFICNTFESPSIMDKGHSNPLQDTYAKLNRQVCLLLAHLNVPTDFFEELMGVEIARVVAAKTDKQAAWDFLRRSKTSTALYETKEIDADKEFLSSDDLLSSNNKNVNDMATDGLEFLLSGHELTEPKLEYLIRYLQCDALKKLQRCNMRLKQSSYLVGVADPFDVLEEGEVCISLPSDDLQPQQQQPQQHMSSSRSYIVSGPVAVTRNPMHHPGDIRVLNAVENAELSHYLQQTNGGVIFFSTKGRRSSADEMSGGDFDGDLYLVIYNQDVVQHVRRDEKPYTARELTSVTATAGMYYDNVRGEQLRLQIMRGFLTASWNALIGKYTNAWMACAEEGNDPSHPDALACHEILMVAHDASKTGLKVIENKRLLDRTKPIYLEDSSENGTDSVNRPKGVCSSMYLMAKGEIIKINELDIDDKRPAPRDEDIMQWINNSDENVIHMKCKWRELLMEYKTGCKYKRIAIGTIPTMYFNQFDIDAKSFLTGAMPLSREASVSDIDAYEGLLANARQRLAAIVYAVTYESAYKYINDGNKKTENNMKSGGYPVYFCWGICRLELHKIKSNAVKKKQRQSSLAVLPNSVLDLI
eukprot:gene3187-6288_t